MFSKYPAVGFHFLVTFELIGQTPVDTQFQEVSGLDVQFTMESFNEGGQNRFVHQLPVRTQYTQLTLKRGYFIESVLTRWFREAIEDFNIQPVNLLITLLNESHLPVQSWYVVNAFPKKWQLSNFNAMENNIVFETLVLQYSYFNHIIP